jgi:hypothetical protein
MADAKVRLAARNRAILMSSSLSFRSTIMGQPGDAFPLLLSADKNPLISATLKPALCAARIICNRLTDSRG